jgi:hypothetical protein
VSPSHKGGKCEEQGFRKQDARRVEIKSVQYRFNRGKNVGKNNKGVVKVVLILYLTGEGENSYHFQTGFREERGGFDFFLNIKTRPLGCDATPPTAALDYLERRCYLLL